MTVNQRNGSCTETQFTCFDISLCIDTALVCDGVTHCTDNSDETKGCHRTQVEWYLGLVMFVGITLTMCLAGSFIICLKKKSMRPDTRVHDRTTPRSLAANSTQHNNSSASVIELAPTDNAKARMYAPTSAFYATESAISIEINESAARESFVQETDLNNSSNESPKRRQETSVYPKQQYTMFLASNLNNVRTFAPSNAFGINRNL
ncbi:uncharacterized protein [Amphiura filiformis]|uniref:uncharacterized protein n=1 Tax=Amphiura filiformis TaxID=82378 RepID=UPI003B20DD36